MNETKTTANLEAIDYVELVDEILHYEFRYGKVTKKKWSWRKFKYITTIEEGFYNRYDDEPYIYKPEFILDPGVVIRENEILYKSYVNITYRSKKQKIKKFDNYHEALAYYTNLIRKMPLKVEL